MSNRDKEQLHAPIGIHIQKLDLSHPESPAIIGRLIELYSSPSNRYHLISPPDSQAILEEEGSNGYEVYVAVDATKNPASPVSERIIGAVTLHPLDAQNVDGASFVEIARLVVDPSMIRRGIGTELLDHAVERVFEGRADEAVLGILGDAPGWEVAMSLYLKRGFIFQPEQSRVISIRELGLVEDVGSLPFPSAQVFSDRRGIEHYVSVHVPMYGMGLSREAYLQQQEITS